VSDISIADVDANMQELQRRGYTPLIDSEGKAWAFVRGQITVMISTVRGSGQDYFKGLMNQKESQSFKFELL
jgi:hypothetical protein